MQRQVPRHQRPARLGKFLFVEPLFTQYWTADVRAGDPARMAEARRECRPHGRVRLGPRWSPTGNNSISRCSTKPLMRLAPWASTRSCARPGHAARLADNHLTRRGNFWFSPRMGKSVYQRSDRLKY